ncbi:hypothetical protein [Actinoplanes sp. RD1]|uniref:hypothetical protein n=1 Tax=Actinoplanes sp. RD1 TaxID=3064538 RepID=UPI0027417298|nr:hypothetical protein [Actinoplanes sp. RD1]
MSVGYVLSILVGLLPEAGVILAGFVLVPRTRERLGRRSTTLAYLGLGALAAGLALSFLWSLLIPTLIGGEAVSASVWQVLNLIVGLIRTVFSAGGVALLLGALLTRNPAGAGLADRAPGGFLGTVQEPASGQR